MANLIAVALILTACGPGRPVVDESLTVWEAKAIAQSMEDEIVALLPAKYVDSAYQDPEGVLLRCSPDRGEQWTGWSEVQLSGAPTVAELFAELDARFAHSDEYSIETHYDYGHELRYIRGAFSSIWIIRYRIDHNEVAIDSGSPCFRLPEGVYPAGEF